MVSVRAFDVSRQIPAEAAILPKVQARQSAITTQRTKSFLGLTLEALIQKFCKPKGRSQRMSDPLQASGAPRLAWRRFRPSRSGAVAAMVRHVRSGFRRPTKEFGTVNVTLFSDLPRSSLATGHGPGFLASDRRPHARSVLSPAETRRSGVAGDPAPDVRPVQIGQGPHKWPARSRIPRIRKGPASSCRSQWGCGRAFPRS